MYEIIRDFFAGSAVRLPLGHGATILMNKGMCEWLKLLSVDIEKPVVINTEYSAPNISEIVRLFANLITRS
jgi:hypothetical protein